ncbi:MAG: penicillin-binding protein 1A [Spirochaetes bacterium]|nr:MAG: penicillin-binding protein 1A [Spirochaetota bacterium]
MARFRSSNPLFTIIISLVSVIFLGAAMGALFGGTVNVIRNENFTEFKSDLPTRLYDIKGRLITEFFAEEKRNPVSINELPDHLIGAFVTREDQSFFSHPGFTLKGIIRAAYGQVAGRNLGGGSRNPLCRPKGHISAAEIC